MGLMTRIADKTGALGSVVSAMGCAACFPALASFGAAIGLGFLIDRNLKPKKIKKTPKNGCLFNTACVP
ncbi:hypothetical protein GKT77_24610 [Salmonella enterica]|nr:hypothetical protein [Salmonella enterica]EEM5331069.1 hypothetical protein [Salmonella enterica]